MGSSVPDITQIGQLAPPELADGFRHEVANLLKTRSTHFPGAQPVSFARQHLKELKGRDYFVCEKSDGIRCLLWFTENDAEHNYEEIHYLIDRKNDYYWVQGLHFPKPAPSSFDKKTGQEIKPDKNADPVWDSHHTDTILDGELLWDTYPNGKRVLKYLVFDCLVLGGQSHMTRTLDKRLGFFRDHILEPYNKLWTSFPQDCEANFPFKVEEKSTQRSYGIEMMFREVIPSLKHGSDGLIFTCRETPYKSGTDPNILKWKPAEENTIDFKLDLRFPRIQETTSTNGDTTRPDAQPSTFSDEDMDEDDVEYDYEALPEFILHINGPSSSPTPNSISNSTASPSEFSTLHVTTPEWTQMKNWSLSHNDGLDGQIVECHKDNQGRWRFNRFRDDKSDANHITVAKKVLQSIDDAVMEGDLKGAAYEIRKAWKSREEVAEKMRKEVEEKWKREREQQKDKERRVNEERERERLLRQQQQQLEMEDDDDDDHYD